MVQHPLELGTVLERPAGLVGPYPDAPSRLEGIGLKMGVLLGGADSGVAEEVSHPASVSKTAGEGVDERLFSDTAYGSGEGLFLDDHLWVVKNGPY